MILEVEVSYLRMYLILIPTMKVCLLYQGPMYAGSQTYALAIKECRIASERLAIHDHQNASMSYQTNYSKREYFVSHTWDI